MPKLTHLLLGVAAAGSFGAGCGGGGEDEATAVSRTEATASAVTVEAFSFDPDPLVVPAGTTITFRNEDAIDHTVTAGTREAPTPELFDGDLPEKGSTFELTLDAPGTYEYFCEIHPGPGMTATITVTDSDGGGMVGRPATAPAEAPVFGDLFEGHDGSEEDHEGHEP